MLLVLPMQKYPQLLKLTRTDIIKISVIVQHDENSDTVSLYCK